MNSPSLNCEFSLSFPDSRQHHMCPGETKAGVRQAFVEGGALL